MKFIYQTVMVASAALLIACSGAETNDTRATKVAEAASKVGDTATMETKTKAVLIYADWCGSCKVLDPKLKAVQASFGDGGTLPGLEFVALDFTDKNVENFYAQAETAGVGDAVKAYLEDTVKTGQLLLVDLDDQTVVGKVTKTFEAPEIVTALKNAISAS